MTKPGRSGFTLIELMIVVAIVSILAAVAIPQFANMVAKAQEATTKGNIGAIRSALSIYYSDNEGYVLQNLQGLTAGGKYLAQLPYCYLPRTPFNDGHPARNVQDGGGNNMGIGIGVAEGIPGAAGGWAYAGYNPANAPMFWPPPSDIGKVMVSCAHMDLKGNVWYVEGLGHL